MTVATSTDPVGSASGRRPGSRVGSSPASSSTHQSHASSNAPAFDTGTLAAGDIAEPGDAGRPRHRLDPCPPDGLVGDPKIVGDDLQRVPVHGDVVEHDASR